MAPKSGRYSKLPSDEDGEVEAHSQLSPATHRGCWRIFRLGAWVFTTLLLAACLLLLVAAITREPSDRECLIKLSVWSPAFEAVEHVDVQFQNGFHEKSIYRGKPTPDLEQAWLELWNFGPVNIPVDKLRKLNKSAEVDWQRVKPEKGGGVLGSLEVFHQLHCLDLIRQYTYRDEYDYSTRPAFDGTPQQIREHVDHCINSLRMYLQCAADVTPYLTKRDARTPLGIEPDFNTRHKCRDFEKIRKWAAKHALDPRDYQNDV